MQATERNKKVIKKVQAKKRVNLSYNALLPQFHFIIGSNYLTALQMLEFVLHVVRILLNLHANLSPCISVIYAYSK